MRLLSKHVAILKRYGTGGSYDEFGKFTDGAYTETPNFLCSFQPAFRSGYITQNLPEGVDAKDCKLIYSHQELLTGDEQKNISADVLEFRGEDYEIFMSNPWDGAGRIVAWEALGIRKDVLR
jgi:hypothetical protein